MATLFHLLCLALRLCPPPVHGPTYTLSEAIIGPSFYDKFIWFPVPDYSHGRANYTDKETSRLLNLTYTTPDTFVLRADYTTLLDTGGAGRNSVRIRTSSSYTTHVAVFDIRHMPEGCGTWPAIWETKPTDWPTGGEVDILEGVHGKSPNLASLHTTPGCTMPANRTQTGTSVSDNCQGGCNVQFPMANSFGSSFNTNGGGWFALERRMDFIKMWFWDRKATNVPPSIREGMGKLHTDSWGTPVAYFPNTTCDMMPYFDIAAIRIYEQVQ
ncbi:hypothetical protein FA13DRAFT_1755858 [Coprinellus micaceus]|uniref:GH16 domain-containing protein n=1 Tax=Coprinellus micaceus TaxID=71717 RepID=A0A4Y7T462_COPMI|nr:hypothetical protein FA13DRAFT_1755858 [Coprinellus micaceus]